MAVDVMGLLKEVMNVTSAVGELKGSVKDLQGKVEKHTEQIIRLEEREQRLAQEMANTAIKAVFDMTAQYFDRISTVEAKLGLPQSPASPPAQLDSEKKRDR